MIRYKTLAVLGLILMSVILIHNIGTAAKKSADNPVAGLDPGLKAIIRYGTLAPSSHNAQMWKVKVVSDRVLIIMLDKTNLLPKVDPANREALISLGAFIENMVQAAPAYKLNAAVHVLTDNPFADEVAKVTFTDAAASSSENAATAGITKRYTDRRPYLDQALLPKDIDTLRSLGANLAYFSLPGKEGQYIKDAIIQSMKQQTENDIKQKEFGNWVRFSKKEAETKKDGITPEMMGLSGLAKWFVGWFYTPKTVMSKSFREQTAVTVLKQTTNCAGFFTVTSENNSVASLIDAGRTLERFWTKSALLGIAVHPMSSILEESPWKEEVNKKLGTKAEIQMVLRVGYVKKYGPPASKRRDLDLVIVGSDSQAN